MNQFFNIKRFANYAAYDVRTNYKRYLIAAAIGFIVVFVTSYLLFEIDLTRFRPLEVAKNYDTPILITGNFFYRIVDISFIVLAFSVSILYPAFVLLSFPTLKNNNTTMNYLLLPASVFEKFLLEVFIRTIVGFGLFLLIFDSASNLAISVFELRINAKYADIVALHQHRIFIDAFTYNQMRNYIANDLGNDLNLPSNFNLLWSFMAWGIMIMAVRLFFKRFAFIKTLITIVVFTTIISSIIRHFGLNEDLILLSWNPEGIFSIDSNDKVSFLAYLSSILQTLFFLFLGYYLLKKKHV
ncbi:MAG: hypothetical protein LBI15_04430 [Dysgonamonadaceae bacterium]|jgi:hypothetical protein|nr:hypothetical protein [Dysgonamonadaceae bacterium]